MGVIIVMGRRKHVVFIKQDPPLFQRMGDRKDHICVNMEKADDDEVVLLPDHIVIKIGDNPLNFYPFSRAACLANSMAEGEMSTAVTS